MPQVKLAGIARRRTRAGERELKWFRQVQCRRQVMVIMAFAFLFIIGLLGTVPGLAADNDVTGKPSEPPKKPAAGEAEMRFPLKVTLSKETTRILEPLTPDGYPDYLEYLNRKYSRGVTPENNAAVVLWQIVGPAALPENIRAEYFRRLGVPIPPIDGDYFLEPVEFYRKRREPGFDAAAVKRLEGEYEDARCRPWTANDHPRLAVWLAKNEPYLVRAEKMSRRERFHCPLIANSPRLRILSVQLSHGPKLRAVGRALLVRAMFRLGDGNKTGAWRDVLATRRLARHAAAGPILVDSLIGIAIAQISDDAVAAIAHYGRPTPRQAKLCCKQLKETLCATRIVEQVDEADRYWILEAGCELARRGPKMLPEMMDLIQEGSGMEKRNHAVFEKLFDGVVFDPDEVLKVINEGRDELLMNQARIINHADRRAALLASDRAMRAAGKELLKTLGQLREMSVSGPEGRTKASKYVGAELLLLTLPAMDACLNAEETNATREAMNELVLALGAYRTENRSYPDKLEQLVPTSLDKLPHDSFNGTEFHYERKGDGFRLYSIGPNGKDEGGKGYDENCDDLLWKVPAASKTQNKS